MFNPDCNNEVCGVRLLRLLDTHLLSIARSEMGNDSRICLYGTGEYWHGFERSAYFLSHLFTNLDTFVVNHPGSPFPIVGVSVSDKTLRQYMQTHTAHRKGDDYIELTVTTHDTDKYGAWHSGKVNEFRV